MPSCVILDEPEAALDDAGRRALSRLLERLAAGRKVLVVAHDASIIPASFDRHECRRGPEHRPANEGLAGRGEGAAARG